MKKAFICLLVFFCVFWVSPTLATEAGNATGKAFSSSEVSPGKSTSGKKPTPKEESTLDDFLFKEKKENEKIRQEILKTQENIIKDLEEARKKLLSEIEKTLKEDQISSKRKPARKPADKKKESGAAKKKASSKIVSVKKKEKAKRPTIPDYIHVFPESKTFVPVSRIDINRLVCSKGKVSGVFYSRDKGLVATKAGKNLFLRIIPQSFAFEHPFELYLICNDKGEEYIYTMILTPEDISSRTIVLQAEISSTIPKKSYTDPRMKRIIDIVKQAYNEDFDRSFKVQRVFRKTDPAMFRLPKEMQVIRYLEVDSGNWVAELYFLSSKLPSPVKLTEEQFVSDDTVAVSVFTPTVPANGFGKVLIIREKIKSIFD